MVLWLVLIGLIFPVDPAKIPPLWVFQRMEKEERISELVENCREESKTKTVTYHRT